MRKILLAAVMSLCATAALAESTIDPTIPADHAPLTSSAMRQQFLRAFNDIHGIENCFEAVSAPGTPLRGQCWLDTSVSATVQTLRRYDGAQWVLEGVLDTVNHAFFGGSAIVDTNAALVLVPTSIGKATRLGFTVRGDHPPVQFTALTGNCAANSLVNDGGSCVNANDGGSWKTVLPAAGADVRIWSADSTGVTSSQTAVIAADAATVAAKIPLIFPGGTFKMTTVTPATGAHWKCADFYGTTLQAANATSDFLVLSNNHVTIEDCQVGSAVPRSSGAYIKTSAFDPRLRHLYLIGPGAGGGMVNNAGTSQLLASGITIANSIATTGVGWQVNGCYGCKAEQVIIIGSNAPAAGFDFVNLPGDFECHGCDSILATANMRIRPASGQGVVSLKWIGGHLDSPAPGGTNLFADPTGTGYWQRSDFTGTWFGSGIANNVALTTDATSIIDGISFENSESVNSAGSGLVMSSGGGPITGVSWIGGKIAGNVYGAYIDGAVDTIISGAQIGAVGGFAANSLEGIALVGTSDSVSILGNQLSGNGITNISSGTSNQITGNNGYNPVGGDGITVTGSPMTYTASASPETVYITAGTVSSVTTAGVTACAASPCTVNLGPNESLVTTYSVAPTMNKSIH